MSAAPRSTSPARTGAEARQASLADEALADPVDASEADAPPARTGARAAGGPARETLGDRIRLTVRRLMQLLVDFVITCLLCLIPIGLAGLFTPTNPDGTVRAVPATFLVGMALLSCVALGAWYWAAWPSRSQDSLLGGQGRTAGMRLFGLRVVDESGGPATVPQLLLRWAGLLIDGLGFGAVGLTTVLVTRRGQRIGDLAAGTVVISDPKPESAEEIRRAATQVRQGAVAVRARAASVTEQVRATGEARKKAAATRRSTAATADAGADSSPRSRRNGSRPARTPRSTSWEDSTQTREAFVDDAWEQDPPASPEQGSGSRPAGEPSDGAADAPAPRTRSSSRTYQPKRSGRGKQRGSGSRVERKRR